MLRMFVALAVLALGAALAEAHPGEGSIQPTSFSSAVQLIREETNGLDRSASIGDFVDVRRRAACFDTLAAAIPPFVLTLETALRDSAVGVVMRTSARLRGIAARCAAPRRHAMSPWSRERCRPAPRC